MAPTQEERWLSSADRWKGGPKLGSDWKPVKVLGRGGGGITGLWEWRGTHPGSGINRKVVKQGKNLEAEHKILRLLNYTLPDPKHVPKLYNYNLIRDKGLGAGRFDQGDVHRMIMEYCEGGDLDHWLRTRPGADRYITEKKLWEIFHCLARGLVLMHHGSEDLTRPRWNVEELVHFDIKLENILIGTDLDDDEHKNSPAFKIADFGIAAFVPGYEKQDADFHKQYSRRGTEPWLLPEIGRCPWVGDTWFRPWLEDNKTPGHNPRYFQNEKPGARNSATTFGSKSNVWQVGMVMWCLINLVRRPKWGSDMRLYTGEDAGINFHAYTVMGRREFDVSAGRRGRYSRELYRVVGECLLVEQHQRPEIEDVYKWTKDGLDRIRAAEEEAVARRAELARRQQEELARRQQKELTREQQEELTRRQQQQQEDFRRQQIAMDQWQMQELAKEMTAAREAELAREAALAQEQALAREAALAREQALARDAALAREAALALEEEFAQEEEMAQRADLAVALMGIPDDPSAPEGLPPLADHTQQPGQQPVVGPEPQDPDQPLEALFALPVIEIEPVTIDPITFPADLPPATVAQPQIPADAPVLPDIQRFSTGSIIRALDGLRVGTPPPQLPAGVQNIDSTVFVYQRRDFYTGILHVSRYELRDLPSDMPLLSVKRRLELSGCPIPADFLKLTNGRDVFADHHTLGQLVANGPIVRVTDVL